MNDVLPLEDHLPNKVSVTRQHDSHAVEVLQKLSTAVAS